MKVKQSMAQSNWKARQLRRKAASQDQQRASKRSRLGNRQDRAIYKSAKGHNHPKYADLCARANRLNGR